MKFNPFYSRAGFTIIEVMNVVALFALMAALAIPLYSRLQTKSLQSEAKIALASIYSSEEAFFSVYSMYISAFDALHYIPSGPRRYYTVGWSGLMTAKVKGYFGTYGVHAYDSTNTFSTVDCPTAVSYPLLPPPLSENSKTFLVGAVGEVRVGTGCEVWTIDNDKNLQNTVSNP